MPVDVRDMKRRTALELFEHEPLFRVIVYTHVPGVLLPDNWMKVPQCELELGADLPVPIRDLVIDDEGISGTLSFGRVPFFCRVPWDAVGALAVVGSFAVGWQVLGEPRLEVAVLRVAKSPGFAWRV